MAAAKKTQGLFLTLEGAPHTPHFIPGVPGLYRPDVATPVGVSVDLARAKEIDADPTIPLALVDITDAGAAERAYDHAIADSKNVQRQVRRGKPKGGEAALLQDEIDATKGA